jgi:hypothetical protein
LLSADWNDVEQRALSYFRACAATFIGNPPPEHDLINWLILMQHYGAPTRLLDWSESPFVAAYFAYSEMPPSQREPAVLWAYDTALAITTLKEGDPPLRFPEPRDANFGAARLPWADEVNKLVHDHIEGRYVIPLPVAPINPDPRMIAQQAILTVDACLKGGSMYPLPAGTGGLDLIYRIELPAEWRSAVLSDLAQMGITAAGLFPDIGGVALHASRIIRDGFVHVRSVIEGHLR